MYFILNEASVEDDDFNNFSDELSEEEFSEDESDLFIDEEVSDGEQNPSFYRSLENSLEVKFINQETNVDPNDFDGEYFADDNQPELYDPENAENVEFNTFENDQDLSSAFKNCLLRFEKTDNPFSYAIIFGVMYQKLKPSDILLEKAKETLGTVFFEELKKINQSIMLDHLASEYFNQCLTANNVLSKYGFFLQFYERRNKFRFQLRQNLKEKNKMKRELSACVILKFSGYSFLRQTFRFEEKKDLIPINIVHEPTLNDQKPIECFFAPEIEKAYCTSFEVERRGKKSLSHRNAKQCCYFEKKFVKSKEKMEKHLTVCSGKIEINYVFDNGKILSYQDNYNKIGDLPLQFIIILKQPQEVLFFLMPRYM